jgi:heavy metal sensor kinase
MALPLRARLGIWYFALFSVAFGVFGFGMFAAMNQAIERGVDSDLTHRLAGIEAWLAQHSDESPREIADGLREHSVLRRGGDILQVHDGHGRLIYQSSSFAQLASALPKARAAETGLRTEDVHDVPLRILSADSKKGTSAWRIELAQSLGEQRRVLQSFSLLFFAAAPLMLFSAAIVGYWMAGRALRPVAAIADEAGSIGARNLSRRLRLPRAHDEIHALSTTLNSMFERLETAFERITQFTADASHELRTPISIVRTTAELALENPLPRDAAASFQSILEESERMTSLVESLLILARADSGKPVDMEPVHPDTIVRDVCTQMSVIAAAKDVSLLIPTRLSPALTLGNAELLRRLFVIIVDNAIKYTPSGGYVAVGLSEEGGAINVAFEDSGIGIPPGHLPFLFERFYRVDKVRDRESGGAGLGLSIAKWIADAHRARLHLDSEPGRGTVVSIRFSALDECVRASKPIPA